MHYLLLLVLSVLLNSCVGPVYDGTTYGIDEFVIDSSYIAAGKETTLELSEQESAIDPLETDCYQDELIIEGDELEVILHCPNRPDFISHFNLIAERVGFSVCDGKIVLPYIEPVEVVGLTLKEIQSVLQELYTEQISDIRVYVGFRNKKRRFIQIIGTAVPCVEITEPTKLSRVIAKANLHPYANLFKSYVVRNEQHLPIDFYRLIHEGDEQQNILMQGGDQLYIAPPEAVTVMVTGEIYSKVIPIPNGFISLIKALANVGGIPYTGDKSYIHVIRGELKHPKIYTLAWHDIIQESHQSLLLMTGDIVYVTEKPITQWNRFVSQLDINLVCFKSSCAIYGFF